MKNSRKRDLIKTVAKLMFLVFLICTGSYLIYNKSHPTFKKDGAIYTRDVIGRITGAQKDSDSEILKDKGPAHTIKVIDDTDASYWEIVNTRLSPSFPTGIRFGNHAALFSQTNPVLRWKNYLIAYIPNYYVDISSGATLSDKPVQVFAIKTAIRNVRIYNLDTDETFDISMTKPTWGELEFATAHIINDKYYFGVGGYRGIAYQYELSLPPTRDSKILKLTNLIGDNIQQSGPFVIGSFCYEGCSYNLYVPITRTSKQLSRISGTYNLREDIDNEQFIGFDNNGRAIFEKVDVTRNADGTLNTKGKGLVAAYLDKENIDIAVLSPSNLPAGEYKYVMINNLNKILILGEHSFIYNVDTKTLHALDIGDKLKSAMSEATPIPFGLQIYPQTQTDSSICFGDNNTEEKARYEIDLVQEKYFDYFTEKCNDAVSNDPEVSLKNLNLDPKFELRKTTQTLFPYRIFQDSYESDFPQGTHLEILK